MSTPHDWPEDFSHENGNYGNTCCLCGVRFAGHKRRVVCKKCASTPPPAIVDETPIAVPVNEKDADDFAELLTPDFHGSAAKRAALDRIIQRAITAATAEKDRELVELRKLVEELDYRVYNYDEGRCDHACRKCVENAGASEELVIPGFVCTYHKVCARVDAARQTGGTRP